MWGGVGLIQRDGGAAFGAAGTGLMGAEVVFAFLAEATAGGSLEAGALIKTDEEGAEGNRGEDGKEEGGVGVGDANESDGGGCVIIIKDDAEGGGGVGAEVVGGVGEVAPTVIGAVRITI